MDFFVFLTNNWYASLPLLIILISWYIYETNKGGKKIAPSEAVAMVNANHAMFLDIRDKESFETGHIHGSINIQKEGFEKQEHLLKKDKAVIVVSENGLDAGSAGVELKRIGIEQVYLLKNGLISWYEESLPLVK
tara:strand:- start:57 stop:461 length:405 start_codon:yes stop_codon:yes gene_type:complete